MRLKSSGAAVTIVGGEECSQNWLMFATAYGQISPVRSESSMPDKQADTLLSHSTQIY